MVDESDDDFPKSPVERIARRLIETARQEPSLLGRSRPLLDLAFRQTELAAQTKGALSIPWPAGTSLALYQQCEQLASVAVEAAQQAEDAFAAASAAFVRARRGMVAFGAFGALGIAVALTALLMNRDHAAAAPNSAIMKTAAVQQPSPEPVTQPAAMHATYVPPLPLPDHQIAKPPEVNRQSATLPAATYINSAPWPANQEGPLHRPTRSGHVVLPPFMQALQRDVSLLFHAP